MIADETPKAELCGEIPCAAYRDKLECRVQALEQEKIALKASLNEMIDALENVDRHVGLLGGECAKLVRARKLMGREAPKGT